MWCARLLLDSHRWIGVTQTFRQYALRQVLSDSERQVCNQRANEVFNATGSEEVAIRFREELKVDMISKRDDVSYDSNRMGLVLKSRVMHEGKNVVAQMHSE